MSRQRLNDRPKRKELNIPTSICNAVDTKLCDRFTGKPIHGAWSDLVSSLLEEWLDKGGVEILRPETKQPFCATCLADLPLIKECLIEECKYERITDSESGNIAESTTGTVNGQDQTTSIAPVIKSKGTVVWGGTDLHNENVSGSSDPEQQEPEG